MLAQIPNKIDGKKVIIFWILSFIAIFVGILHTSLLSFVNDDAFISLRYAKNLVTGFGLVYNAGERVECYTNYFIHNADSLRENTFMSYFLQYNR